MKIHEPNALNGNESHIVLLRISKAKLNVLERGGNVVTSDRLSFLIRNMKNVPNMLATLVKQNTSLVKDMDDWNFTTEMVLRHL